MTAPHCAVAWHNLGCVGGGIVKGQHYTGLECVQQAAELGGKAHYPGPGWSLETEERSLANAFFKKGRPHFGSPWLEMGFLGGGIVHGGLYTALQCFQRAVELDMYCPQVWCELACAGGGVVRTDRTLHHTPAMCFERALTVEHQWDGCSCKSGGRAWAGLGIAGGGIFDGFSFRAAECFIKALLDAS